MSDPSPSAGSAGQTFLVGETIYLRGLEVSDARRASAWRSSPFPIAAERAEAMLKKELPAAAERRTTSLVACRIDGDEPVGATTVETADWRTGWVKLHADPALGRAAADVKAEIVRLVVPWLSDERHMMVVHVSVDADQGPVVAAAEAVGMRRRSACGRRTGETAAGMTRSFTSGFIRGGSTSSVTLGRGSTPRDHRPWSSCDQSVSATQGRATGRGRGTRR